MNVFLFVFVSSVCFSTDFKESDVGRWCVQIFLSAQTLPFLCSGVVQQQRLARHGVICQCDEQRPAESESATRSWEEEARHHCLQSPTQPHQGAAHRSSHVSSLLWRVQVHQFGSCARCISSIYVRGKIRVDLNSVHCCKKIFIIYLFIVNKEVHSPLMCFSLLSPSGWLHRWMSWFPSVWSLPCPSCRPVSSFFWSRSESAKLNTCSLSAGSNRFSTGWPILPGTWSVKLEIEEVNCPHSHRFVCISVSQEVSSIHLLL